MISASIRTLHEANSSQYEECWLCYSPQPPFYDGIAVFGTIEVTSDSKKPRWHPEFNEGLTLSRSQA